MHRSIGLALAALAMAAPGVALAQSPAQPSTQPPAAKPATPAPTAVVKGKEVPVHRGADAFGDWRLSKPGTRWLITPRDLPKPGATEAASNPPSVVKREASMAPVAPDGFSVTLFASGFDDPRRMAVAPNGDIFVVESGGGRVKVLRPDEDGSKPADTKVFAEGLNRPYGIAFYPADKPQWIYVAETDKVVRFPYKDGDMVAGAARQVIVDKLPTGGHWTRDITFSLDGQKLFIAVGSSSNVAERMESKDDAAIKAWEVDHGRGAAWGNEERRAAVLVSDPEGKDLAAYATGIRNCAGIATEPQTGSPWCATNERDGLGDNLPPDYVTRVQQGGFYGWPWFYIGANGDPRHPGARGDLAGFVVEPDVLIQPHSAPLGLVFYKGKEFPEDYAGDVFVTLHGSWNRGKRTGYKVVRVLMQGGQPTGVYEDFLTGFVVDDGRVWGRPVGLAVMPDGSLLVSEDGSGTIWRVTHNAGG